MTASSAGAAPAPDVFRLTISGSASASWDYTTAPTMTADCTSSQSSHGARTVAFRSSRPTLVRFVGGRLGALTVRGLRGSVSVFGTNTTNQTCAGVETHVPVACVDTTREFRGAHAALDGPRAGRVAIRAVAGAPARSSCPSEPADVQPLGPPPGPLHISVATLRKARTKRITLTASASRTKNYGEPEQGMVRQRAKWTFTFVRTGR